MQVREVRTPFTQQLSTSWQGTSRIPGEATLKE